MTRSSEIEHVGTAAFQLREIPRFELFQGSWVIGDRPIGPEEDDRVVDFEIEGEIGTFEGMVDPGRAREIGEAFIEAAARCEPEVRADGGATYRTPEPKRRMVSLKSPIILSDKGYREIEAEELELSEGIASVPGDDFVAISIETGSVLGEVTIYLGLDEAAEVVEFFEEAIARRDVVVGEDSEELA